MTHWEPGAAQKPWPGRPVPTSHRGGDSCLPGCGAGCRCPCVWRPLVALGSACVWPFLQSFSLCRSRRTALWGWEQISQPRQEILGQSVVTCRLLRVFYVWGARLIQILSFVHAFIHFPDICQASPRKSCVSRDPIKEGSESRECSGKESFFQITGTVNAKALPQGCEC